MLKVCLKIPEFPPSGKQVIIQSVNASFPYNLYSDNDNEVYFNLNSIECKNIKGSFQLSVSKIIDISGDSILFNKVTITKSSDEAQKNLVFRKRLLFSINEKNYLSSINGIKQVLPRILLTNTVEAKRNIHFFLDYEGSGKKKGGEEIIFYLNLFNENGS